MRKVLASLTILVLLAVAAPAVQACPFCSAQSQTFCEEIAAMDAAVFARLTEAPPVIRPDQAPPGAEIPKAKFEIFHVLKGEEAVGSTKKIETIFFGQAKPGATYLIMGVDPPNMQWSTPLPVSERVQNYIVGANALPREGLERIQYFYKYLEDEEEMLNRDAYDEFARTPYEVVKQLKPTLDREQLLTWIQNTEIPVSHRRLYLTLLGIAGQPEDAALLEDMIRNEDRKIRTGLDALIACYLIHKGPEGLDLVDELFLKNRDSEYADTYAAIMAIRFHRTETDYIPRERLVESLRHMLARPPLADLVIPDLARWEDWSVMPRLVELFKNADENSSWVRVPVINYLRACPDAKAAEHIKELEKIDPQAVQRANTFFPFRPGSAPGTGPDSNTSSMLPPIRGEEPVVYVPAPPTRRRADAPPQLAAATAPALPATAQAPSSENAPAASGKSPVYPILGWGALAAVVIGLSVLGMRVFANLNASYTLHGKS